MDPTLEPDRKRRMPRTGSDPGARVREVNDGILLATLAGEVDVARIRVLNERLYADISAVRASMVVFDLAGIPEISAELAHELLNTAAMVRLMGAHVRTLGPGVDGIDAVATLAEAVEAGRREAGTVQVR
jgi:anti-anti-sigma regulatory factor